VVIVVISLWDKIIQRTKTIYLIPNNYYICLLSVMSSLKQIREPVKDHIREFEKYFRASMKSNVPMLDRITRYIVNRKGKQMRPLFVCFSAEIAGGVNEST